MSVHSSIQKLKKEDGVTLVELLAAIVILALITTAFLAYFTQAGQTNNRTDEKNEATFIAVEEMERVTSLSQEDLTFVDVQNTYLNNDFNFLDEGNQAESYSVASNDETSLTVNRQTSGYYVTLKIQNKILPQENESEEIPGVSVYQVTVTVEGEGQNRANMQTVLSFEEPTE